MTRAIAAALLLATAPLGASAQLDPKSKNVPTPKSTAAPASKYGLPPGGPPPVLPPLVHNYSTTAPDPVDGGANKSARDLYARLRAEYGKRIFLGQTSDRFAELSKRAGKTPVIKSWDMMFYAPGNPWNGDNGSDDGTVQAAIDWHTSTKGKGIVAFVWHWYSPSGRKFDCHYPPENPEPSFCRDPYKTTETKFDVEKAVTPGTTEYVQTINAIDMIAVQLKKLDAAGVPVLWRPLHEAAGNAMGGWFWWGSKGAGPCLKLYDLMYDRLTNHHQLHNLIWVWSEPNPSWYPGNAKVDIVGYDSYPGAKNYQPQKPKFDALFALTGGKKMLALTETGPVPDVGEALSNHARWVYMASWAKNALEDNEPAHLKEMYAHPAAITLESK